MLGVVVSAVILCGIMYVVARNEAEISLPVVLFIALGVSIVSFLLSMFIGILALPIVLVLLAWALQQFCYLRWKMAWLVTGIYIAVQIGIGLVWGVLTN